MSHGLITVFGGTGFLGRRIVRHFLDADWSVRVAARHSRPELFNDDSPGPELVEADVRDPESIARAVSGANVVVNSVGLYVQNRSESFDTTHVLGAGHVAQASKRVSARLVHVSGIGVDRRSRSPYVRARALGEERVQDASTESVILRPSVLFGPGDSLLSTMIPMITWLPVIPLFGDGESRIQPVYVDDVARAVLAAALPGGKGGVYELGGPDVFSYRELLEGLCRRMGRKRWLKPVSFGWWRFLAVMTSVFPSPPITRDQLELLRHDNVVQADEGFSSLGISAGSLRRILDAVSRAGGRIVVGRV